MSEIIPFPNRQRAESDLELFIEQELKAVPEAAREKLKFEFIKTIDSYDAFFTEWNLTIPKDSDEAFRKQIYDVAHQEHGRKMAMLKDIMKLKIHTLVLEYRR